MSAEEILKRLEPYIIAAATCNETVEAWRYTHIARCNLLRGHAGPCARVAVTFATNTWPSTVHPTSRKPAE